jgi:hypothetical protein
VLKFITAIVPTYLSKAHSVMKWSDSSLFFQPMLDTVKMHPLLVTASKDAETATSRYIFITFLLNYILCTLGRRLTTGCTYDHKKIINKWIN